MSDTAAETFKSTTESVTRAMAREKNADIAFVAGSIPGAPATAAGTILRLPLPDHNLDADNVALVRGSADAAALYRDHHNTSTHNLNAPLDAEATAIYNALEHMRCEALGARSDA